jgi:hypothetical protein
MVDVLVSYTRLGSSFGACVETSAQLPGEIPAFMAGQTQEGVKSAHSLFSRWQS